MVLTKGFSFSRRFPHPCLGDSLLPGGLVYSPQMGAVLGVVHRVLRLRGGVGGQQPWENGSDSSLLSLPRHSWADALSSIRLPYVKYICPHA